MSENLGDVIDIDDIWQGGVQFTRTRAVLGLSAHFPLSLHVRVRLSSVWIDR